ncbi:MAG: hypothetical protein ACOCQD_01530 [archaeon]
MRKISAYLSVKDFDNLINQIDQEIARMDKVESNVITQLLEQGKLIVMRNILKHKVIDTGQLLDSIRIENYGDSGKIIADTPYAGFVEYGTGVRGVGTHPSPPPEWEYGNTGWVYYDEDFGFIYTLGQKGKPFFFEAFLELVNKAKLIGRKGL